MMKMTKILLPALAILASLANLAYGQDNERFTQGVVNDSATASLGVSLMSYKGRGIDLPVSLSYSSSVWRLNHVNKRYNAGGAVWQHVTEAIFAEHSKAGWKSSLDLPRVEFPEFKEVYNFNGLVSGQCRVWRVARVTIHMPDGATYQLRKSDVPHNLGYVDKAGTFYAVDGSRVRYDSTDEDTGILFLPDGTRYVLDGGSGEIIDRHGNTLSYNGGTRTWTDTLGREITNPLPETPTVGETEYVLPGMNGVNDGEVVYKLKWELLENALTDPNDALRYVASHYASGTIQFPQAQNGNAEYMFRSEFGYDIDEGQPHPYKTMVIGKDQSASVTFNPIVLTEITLPDDSKYQFRYNDYAEIDKVVYPPGGFEQYEYESPDANSDGAVASKQPYVQAERRIKARGVSENGTGSDLIESEYDFDYYNGKTTATAPDGTKTETYKFVGPWEGLAQNFGFESGSAAGRVYEKKVFSPTNVLLRRELTQFAETANVFNASVPCQGYDFQTEVRAGRNARVQKTGSLIFENGSNSALAQVSTFGYDTTYETTTGVDQNLAQTYHYTVLSNSNAASYSIDQISAGTLARKTETTFSTDSNFRETKHILGLPTIVEVKDGSGTTVVSRSEMSYDDRDHVPDESTNAMPTTMRTWDSTKGVVTNPSAYLETHATFDVYGNRTVATDAKGYATTTTYDSTYNAFPESVTSPVPDDSNTHASDSAFTTTITYDTPINENMPPLGLVAATTDINGQTTTMEYDDPMLRLKKVTAPNGHETITDYGAGTSESTRWVKVKSQIDSNYWSEAKSFYDGLGRTYKTQKTDLSDPAGDIFTLTCFDDMGRVLKNSNPFRNVSNPTCASSLEWTTPDYDDLSRTEKVTSPDTTDVQITFGLSTSAPYGTTKTITDQAGKKRKGITDAMGNMVRVIEDPDAQSPAVALTTDYVFDTLGNLRKTTQGDQIRFFNYDSLGRVLRAKQVEQDVNANLALSSADEITTNNSWTVKYTYDDNSNIITTTDARNNTITATYDRLNRITVRDYSDTATPDVGFYYDGKYLTASDVLQTATGSVKGKTTGIKSSVSRANNTSFDSMGRVLTSQQITDGQTYPFIYTYNLSGAMIEETYPSGRVVKNTLNADGELQQVQSKKNSSSGFWTYADAFSHNDAGAVTKMQLGNGHWETAEYNDRLQVIKLGLGILNNTQDILKLEFKYEGPSPSSTPDRNNGSMREQKVTVPTVGSNGGFTATQTYTYDSLNRIDVTEEKIGGSTTWKQDFLYDRYGNRRFDAANTTTLGSCSTAICNPTIPTDSTNRNRFSSGQNYTYDAAGSVTQNSQGERFTYDAEGHQKEFFLSSNSGSIPDATYYYDGDGRRIKKISSTETTVFVYDGGGKLVAEYSTALATTPQVGYLTQDHLGSPRVVTNENGVVTDRKDFTAFGEAVASSQRIAALGYSTTAQEPRKDFTGYEKDTESGLEFAQARYYNTQHGRFTSIDPLTASAAIKNPQTFNRYSYVLNSPYKFTDPLGLMAGGCGADKSNCEGGGGTGSSHINESLGLHARGLEQAHKNIKVQKQAQAAANRGDIDAMWDILKKGGNDNFEVRDKNGNSVEAPDSGTVTAEATLNGTYIVADGEPGTVQNVGQNFYRAAMTTKADLEAGGLEAMYFGTVATVDGFQGLLDMAAKYGAIGIALFTHGDPNQIFLGDGKPNDDNTINSTSVKKLVNRSKSLAFIYVYGCNAGFKNNGIAAQMAKQLNVSIHAATGGMNFSNNPNKPSGFKTHPNSGPTYMIHDGGKWRVF